MQLKLLVDGGEMKPGPTVGQALGPVGLNVGLVIQKVNEATKEFKGMKVPVTLEIDSKTKNFDVSVSSPPASELIKKELGIEKGSGKAKEIKVGNISVEQIVAVAKVKHLGMIVSGFKNAVKSIVGTCNSLGILVESKSPLVVISEINEGVYDDIINSQTSEVSPEKAKELKEYFDQIKDKQDKVLQKEAEKKSEEEAKKAAAVTAQPSTATSAAKDAANGGK